MKKFLLLCTAFVMPLAAIAALQSSPAAQALTTMTNRAEQPAYLAHESGGIDTLTAVGIGIGVLLIILIFIWLFMRWRRNWPY